MSEEWSAFSTMLLQWHYDFVHFELLGITCHIGSHRITYNPTQVNTPCLTTARQASTQFTCPRGMKGLVDLGNWLHTELVYPLGDGHP